MDKIQLKKSNSVLKFEIFDEDGNSTGEHITFDIEDIELPRKLEEAMNLHNESLKELKTKMLILNKKEDVKDKDSILSRNDNERIKLIREFYDKDIEALDKFLGENGTKKLLNGRQPYYTMFDDIMEMLEPIMPKIIQTTESVAQRIKAKYGPRVKPEEDGELKLND